MLTRVSRRLFFKEYPDFVRSDNYHNKYFYPETTGNYILHADAQDARVLCSRVAKGLTALAYANGYAHLYFMGDSNTPWLYRSHNYPPVKRALEYLRENNTGSTFNGAIKVNMAELPQFTRHLFWLVRCNGVTFSPHFTDEGFNIIGNICQYGNIHISTLNAAADEAFKEAVPATGLSYLVGIDCGGQQISGRNLL